MRTYERRLAAIEARESESLLLLLRIEGEPPEAAIERYETIHGPVARGAQIIFLSAADMRL